MPFFSYVVCTAPFLSTRLVNASFVEISICHFPPVIRFPFVPVLSMGISKIAIPRIVWPRLFLTVVARIVISCAFQCEKVLHWLKLDGTR